MARNDRLFALAALMKGRRVHRAEDLAARLGVSVRTLYRDVDALRAMGVPIEGAPGIGLRLAVDTEIPAIPFSRAELEALVLGARMVAAWADPALADAAHTAVLRIEGVLPAPLREVLLGVPLHAADFQQVHRPEALGILRAAISSHCAVRFAYADKHAAPSERSVHPLGLHFWGQRWTLASWCTLRKGFRAFRVDRVANVQVGDPFPEDPERGLDAFLRHVREQRWQPPAADEAAPQR